VTSAPKAAHSSQDSLGCPFVARRLSMKGKRHNPEQIIKKLREADVFIPQEIETGTLSSIGTVGKMSLGIAQ
jgi:hypothetical protein